MGTRCNVKITSFGKAPIYLYRHWDGYPAETGKHIVTVLRGIESVNEQVGNSHGRDNAIDQFELANRLVLTYLTHHNDLRQFSQNQN